KGPRAMAEKFALDAVGRARMLIEWKDDHVAGGEPLEDGIERSALGHDAEPGASKPPRYHCVEPAWLDGAAHEMNAAAHLGKIGESGNRRHFETAEVTGDNEHALASIERVGERLDVLYPHRRDAARRRHPAKAQELAKQTPEMGIMRLRQSLDLGCRHGGTEDPAQVLENHSPAQGQELIQQLPGERHL